MLSVIKNVGLAWTLALSFSHVAQAEEAAAGASITPNLEHGAELHRTCALCHGRWSQGINSGRYPRLAGFPEPLLGKMLLDYREGKRNDVAMIVIGKIRTMSDQDYADLIAYINSIDLKKQNVALDIPTSGGDVEEGADLFKADCKSCHGRNGEGSVKKGGFPLGGQYTPYLKKQIKLFMSKQRYHDNDPDDETFAEYTREDLDNLLAFISTLDD
jgi:cytochrome c553